MVLEQKSDLAIDIESEGDIISARKSARRAAELLGFGITDVTRIVTAASALARNSFVHAGSGIMQWRQLDEGGTIGLELKFEDHGPGIANVEQVMGMGHSSRSGLGGGLPGVKRLMDEMEIKSQIGIGTIVTVRKWLRR